MPDEPAIWFRRIVLLERIEPDLVEIRAIPLHRGLNVIRTDVPTAQDLKPVGHDVGKTMFTRLMRYCLGEPNFCDHRTKTAVSRAYPDSYVAAEVVVGGENWSVLRPLGAAHAFESKSGRTASWTDLLGDTESVGIERLIDAITETVLSSTVRPHLRLANRTVRWLDVLQWISRDQRCHATHALEWRDSDTESGNPELQREEAAIVLKTVTGLLSAQERALIESHNELLANKRAVDNELDELKRDLKAEERLINRELAQGLRPTVVADQALMVAERVTAKIKSLQGLLADVPAIYHITGLENAQLDAVRANAKLVNEKSTRVTEKELVEGQMGDEAAAAAKSVPNLLYERCTLDANLCPVKKAAVNFGMPMPLRAESQEVMRQRVALLTAQIAGLEDQAVKTTLAEETATKELNTARERARRHEGAINRHIARLRRLAKLSTRHDDREDRVSFLVKESSRLEREQKESLEAQSNVRDNLEVEELWMNGQFDRVIKHLVGSEYAGRVRIDSKAIRLFGNSEQSSSGEAVRASTLVLGLDLACFAAAVEGHGFLPRLLILDSPRESDMESTIFGRVFGFFSELGDSEKLPNFQAIVTTTTPPPTNSVDVAAIVLNLNRRGNGEGTLLRKIF